MPSRSNKFKKTSDTKSEFNNFSHTHHASVVQRLLLANSIDPEIAVNRLEKISPQPNARLKAGQICVEQAYLDPSIGKISEWLGRAAGNFEKAQETGSPENSESFKARILGETLPIHAVIITTGHLPTPNLADKVYRKVIACATETVGVYDNLSISGNNPEEGKTKCKLAGVFAEVSVMALLMRYGLQIKENESEIDFFANMAKFSDEHANIKGSLVEKAWDVEVMTDLAEDELNYPYRIQVKASATAANFSNREASENISTVILRPDLQLNPGESFSTTTVLSECAYELYKAGSLNSDRITEQLDVRTEKLIDILG